MKKLRPTDDRVVVEMLDPEKASKGGILLPDQYETDLVPQAMVVSVGPGRVLANGKRVMPSVKPGDLVVLYAAGVAVDVDDKKYRIVDSAHIMAVVEEAE